MIALKWVTEGEYCRMTAKVEKGPDEVVLPDAEPWWWTIQGVGVSRNSGKACAYALEDLARQILENEK